MLALVRRTPTKAEVRLENKSGQDIIFRAHNGKLAHVWMFHFQHIHRSSDDEVINPAIFDLIEQA